MPREIIEANFLYHTGYSWEKPSTKQTRELTTLRGITRYTTVGKKI